MRQASAVVWPCLSSVFGGQRPGWRGGLSVVFAGVPRLDSTLGMPAARTISALICIAARLVAAAHAGTACGYCPAAMFPFVPC
jgi:hypothetical protein